MAGREAHIHLCLVSVVRSSTSGLLVASDTDSSPAPSSQPSSLQFVAVGIRRPRRQSYVVFQYVKKPLSFHSLVEGAGFEPAMSYTLRRLIRSAAYPYPRLRPGCLRPLGHPSPCSFLAEGEGFEPPCCCRTAAVLRQCCLALLLPILSANLPCSVCRNIIAALTVILRSLLLSAIQLHFFASATLGTPPRPASAVSSS